jgi:hypothetical protein
LFRNNPANKAARLAVVEHLSAIVDCASVTGHGASTGTSTEDMMATKRKSAKPAAKKPATAGRLKDLSARNAKSVKGGAILRRKAY